VANVNVPGNDSTKKFPGRSDQHGRVRFQVTPDCELLQGIKARNFLGKRRTTPKSHYKWPFWFLIPGEERKPGLPFPNNPERRPSLKQSIGDNINKFTAIP